MKRCILTAMWVALLAAPTLAQEDVDPLMASVAEKTRNALVVVQATYVDNETSVALTGTGICYNAEGGEFMTFALGSSSIKPENIKEVRLILPGAEGDSVEAEFLGIRPEARIGFVKAKEQRDWQAVQFAASANIRPGQKVVSAGLMPNSPGNARYFGLAYASGRMQAPGDLWFVTGGQLTAIGSPVFSSDGLAIGIVAAQPYVEYQLMTQRGSNTMAMRSRQTSNFFMPVDEFAWVLTRIPRDGTVPRLPWIGADIAPPTGEQARLLAPNQVAVRIDQVIPGYPAAEAGLEEDDLVVAFNGKPLQKLASRGLVAQELEQRILRMPVGEELTFTVLREGARQQISLQTVPLPPLPAEAERYQNAQLGLAVREKVDLDAHIGTPALRDVPGLVVIAVARREPPIEINANDLITSVNGQPVGSVEAFKRVVEQSLERDPTAPITLTVRGAAGMRPVAITPAQPQRRQGQ